jgi:hypothetical protein
MKVPSIAGAAMALVFAGVLVSGCGHSKEADRAEAAATRAEDAAGRAESAASRVEAAAARAEAAAEKAERLFSKRLYK